MADFEENIEDMVGTTREAVAVATRLTMRPGTRPAVPGTRPATRRWRRQVMNETAARWGNVDGRRGFRIC